MHLVGRKSDRLLVVLACADLSEPLWEVGEDSIDVSDDLGLFLLR